MIKGMCVRDPVYDAKDHAMMDRMGAALADLGVEWVRTEMHLGADEAYDYFLKVVAPRHNLKVLMLFGFGLLPELHPLEMNKTVTNHPMYGGGVNAYMVLWLDRAREVARRYGSAIHAIEVLNEHNRLSQDDGPGIPAALVSRLHTKFFRFMRQVDKLDTPMITGGLHTAGSGKPFSPGWISDITYARQVLQSEAFMGYRKRYGVWPLDGLGYHPYPVEIAASNPKSTVVHDDTELIIKRLSQLRVMISSMAGNPKFWITEMGYNAAYAKQSHAGQAAALTEWMHAVSERSDVEATFWFKYEDFPPASGPNAQQWGVTHVPFTMDNEAAGGAKYSGEGKPWPSYEAYKALSNSQ